MTDDRPHVRALEEGDKESWRALWREYLAFYETSVSLEVYETTFRRLTSPEVTDCDAHIAFLDGEAVGIVHCVYHLNMWRIDKVCYLQDLYTREDARNRGVARALIEAVYRNADAKKAGSVYWLTQDFNYSARYLYDKVGKVTPFIKYIRK